MIGLYHNWSGRPLPTELANRFAGSLGIGLPNGVGVREVGGATLASAASGIGGAKSWSPARSADGSLSLLMGYIDNRAELIRLLPGDFDPRCDAATLYGRCHAAWGDACDLSIIGQYASIIWSPDSASIRLSRSPIAAPALHIWQDADRLVIASAPRAIFATGEIAQELDEQKIADSLFLNYREEARSWFKGVARLPIGSRARFSREQASTIRYYEPFPRNPIRFARDEDYVEAAVALFEEATRAALHGFSRPAVSVSGGYDSQAVASYALRVMPPDSRLLGLTSIPEPGWDGRTERCYFGDEREHVKALAAMHPRLDVELVDAAGLSFDHKLDAMFLMAGIAPRNAINLHWMHQIRARAKAAGCDVMLMGTFGNATFSFAGDGAMPGWFSTGRWMRLARELWAARGQHKSFAHAVAASLVLPLLPGFASDRVLQWRHGQPTDVFASWCPLNKDWASKMGVYEQAAKMRHDPQFRPPRTTQAWRSTVISNAMNEFGDFFSGMDAVGGIPSRDPTSYRPLLEFCFSIPDDQYLRSGEKRWLAKRMLKGMVPDMVLGESRGGLQTADWHLRLGRQRTKMFEEIDRLATDPKMVAMLDLPRLRRALENWPDETPIGDGPIEQTLQLALTRALSTARFVRYVEGKNA
jgi:asparagine synthase (glutamine-hydrolysing)